MMNVGVLTQAQADWRYANNIFALNRVVLTTPKWRECHGGMIGAKAGVLCVFASHNCHSASRQNLKGTAATWFYCKDISMTAGSRSATSNHAATQGHSHLSNSK